MPPAPSPLPACRSANHAPAPPAAAEGPGREWGKAWMASARSRYPRYFPALLSCNDRAVDVQRLPRRLVPAELLGAAGPPRPPRGGGGGGVPPAGGGPPPPPPGGGGGQRPPPPPPPPLGRRGGGGDRPPPR